VFAKERSDRGVDPDVVVGAEPAVSATLYRDKLVGHPGFVKCFV
jgi:hypothetical protein